jgi:hypothetical protein
MRENPERHSGGMRENRERHHEGMRENPERHHEGMRENPERHSGGMRENRERHHEGMRENPERHHVEMRKPKDSGGTALPHSPAAIGTTRRTGRKVPAGHDERVLLEREIREWEKKAEEMNVLLEQTETAGGPTALSGLWEEREDVRSKLNRLYEQWVELSEEQE